MHSQRPLTSTTEILADKDERVNTSAIQGNASDRQKKASLSLFKYFISTSEKSYGADVGQRLLLTKINIFGEGPSSYAETVVETTVTKDMCNVFRTLHGGCAAYIVDPCSMSALVVLGIQHGFDGTGMSQSMNLIWHRAIYGGTQIKIVSTAIYTRGRVRTITCEIWDKDLNELCISATHSTVNASAELNDAKL